MRNAFIAFLDADDLWTPDKLEAQLSALEENPQAAVAYSWIDHIDESSQFLSPANHTTVSGNIYANLLRGYFLTNGSNALIRRQALNEVGGFDESLTHAEDWDMFLRLAWRYHFVAVPSPQCGVISPRIARGTDWFDLSCHCCQKLWQRFYYLLISLGWTGEIMDALMKVCYFIQSHKQPEQIYRLVRTIKKSSPTAQVLIGHDFTNCYLDMKPLQDLSGVNLLRGNFPVIWGNFSLVQPYLNAINWLVEHNFDFEWLIYLSGQHYPTQPISTIEKLLFETKYDGFLEYFYLRHIPEFFYKLYF